MTGTQATTETVELQNDKREFECVSGHYFDAENGSYVPLSDRRPMNQAEELLKGVPGVSGVAQVARYFHVYVNTSVVDEQEVTRRMTQKGTASKTGRETETRTPRKPYNKEIVFTIK